MNTIVCTWSYGKLVLHRSFTGFGITARRQIAPKKTYCGWARRIILPYTDETGNAIPREIWATRFSFSSTRDGYIGYVFGPGSCINGSCIQHQSCIALPTESDTDDDVCTVGEICACDYQVTKKLQAGQELLWCYSNSKTPLESSSQFVICNYDKCDQIVVDVLNL
jgi:hypothetical protein